MTRQEALDAIAGKAIRSSIKCPQCKQDIHIRLQVDGWDRLCGDTSDICSEAKKYTHMEEITQEYRDLDAAWQAADKDALTPYNEAVADGAVEEAMVSALVGKGYNLAHLRAMESEELDVLYIKEFPYKKDDRVQSPEQVEFQRSMHEQFIKPLMPKKE